MSDFKAKMLKIRFPPGLCPRPRWGSLQRSPRLLITVFKGATAYVLGEGGETGGEKGRGGEGGGKGKGKGEKGEGRKGEEPCPKYFGLQPPLGIARSGHLSVPWHSCLGYARWLPAAQRPPATIDARAADPSADERS